MNLDIKNFVVPKPWGYEYLIFENECVGIWFLHINKDACTSLHCHPNKKTGLIVIKGTALISFLNDSSEVYSLSKLMIWSGVFHSTKSLSQGGIDILEIECPKFKSDLIRMEDVYGRKGKGYESPELWVPRTKEHLWIDDEIGSGIKHNNIKIWVDYSNVDLINQMSDNDVIAILSEHAICYDNFTVCKPGDVINVKTFKRLVKEFGINNSAKLLYFQKTNESVNV